MKQKKTWKRVVLCGEANGKCKYSDDTVLKIRALKESGWSYSKIAKELGIPISSVSTMCNRRKLTNQERED